MNRAAITLLLMCTPASHGCQWLSQMDSQHREEAALEDDRACRNAGYDWPAEAYVDCRRFRDDARQRERWRELQMSRQQMTGEPGIPALSPVEPYRPIREQNYGCAMTRTRSGEPYVDCRESGSPP